ncbi:MAG: EAL domain-containing protein [Nitrospirae bacterium]|nr:EAL domain-containing protein [Nitrospirota bacterium]
MTIKHHKPLYNFIITAISIFVSEALVMLILSNLFFFPIPFSIMLLDASLLTLLIVPTLYFSLVRPLEQNIEKRIRTEEEIKQARNELEMKVLTRTVDLNRTIEILYQEIAERTRAEAESLKTALRLEHLLQSVPAIIYSCRIEGDQLIPNYANCKTNDFMKYNIDECLNNPDWWKDRIHPDDREHVLSILSNRLYMDNHINYEYRLRTQDNTYRWIHDSVRLIRDQNGQPLEIVGSWLDITERKEQESFINHIAYHDDLTGLPNKSRLIADFDQIVSITSRQGLHAAILYIDLNRFKIINDTLGHTVGDEVLKEVASRLNRFIRARDTMARLGGDEFIMIFPEVNTTEDVSKLVDRVFAVLEPPIKLKEHEYTATASIGVSIYPEDGTDLETLIRKADAAMYKAKGEKQNSCQLYTANMHVVSIERLKMEEKLRRAFGNNEFLLHYQPQLDIDKGEIIGIEALVRWDDPKLGLIPPGKFIPLSEETGLIIPLGKWIAETACRQSKAWQDKGLNPAVISINVSRLQFKKKDFLNSIRQNINETGIDPTLLEIEITESIIMDDAETTFNLLNQLRETGVRIAIDDFGIGYSSLAYLKNMPIDILKIDQSFVNNITEDENSRAICHAIIAMADSLHVDVIAEGVETMEQLLMLRDLNCKKVQGYLISKPVPANDFEHFLNKDWQFRLVNSSTGPYCK